MKKPIIILNGPARVGKDTIAKAFEKAPQTLSTAFKRRIWEVVALTMGMRLEAFLRRYDGDEGWKDTPQKEWGGKSVRDLMIHTSETYIKPFFGSDYYGAETAKYIAEVEELWGENSWIIPDGGFQPEVDALVDKFGERVIVIQLTREGYSDFTGDSRGWVMGPVTVVFDTTNGNDQVIKWINGKINSE